MDSSEAYDDTMEMLSANLPSSAFTTNRPDPRLERARQETERTNQITPLLKEELRLRILSKRLQKGEPEIEINSGEPRSYELTEEEQAKRERRKAQNRRAAKKCREKRKMRTLSDAEKYRIIREENQQLRNDVTYLRHKEDVYKRFCFEHIFHNQCSSVPSDESSKRQLLALLGSNMMVENHVHHRSQVTATSSTPGSVSGSQLQPIHTESSNSSSSGVHSSYQGQDQVTFPVGSMTLSSTAAQAVFHAEQGVTAMRELKVLPVHEISSLLPPESDFSVSDHSLESTSPELSPSSFFNTTSHHVTGAASTSYFSHLPPSTSFPSHNTNSFSPNNEDLFPASPLGNTTHLNASFLDYSVSLSDVNQHISRDCLQETVNTHDQRPRQVSVAGSHTDAFTTQEVEQHIPRTPEELSSYPRATEQEIESDGRNVYSLAVTNSVIVNTAFHSDFSSNLEPFLSNLLSLDHLPSLTCSFNVGTHEEPVIPTVPISPLTPLSPPSPNVTPSPSVTVSPLSPSETHRKDGGVAHVPSSTPLVPSSQNAVTQVHSIARLISSTTPVPSPYGNHLVSFALSPPPSVPSPTSNGVPESPSVLALSSACDESAYGIPHISPFSAESSTDCSPVGLFDISEGENY